MKRTISTLTAALCAIMTLCAMGTAACAEASDDVITIAAIDGGFEDASEYLATAEAENTETEGTIEGTDGTFEDTEEGTEEGVAEVVGDNTDPSADTNVVDTDAATGEDTKTSPDTGVASIAGIGGIALLAAGALVISSKRNKK